MIVKRIFVNGAAGLFGVSTLLCIAYFWISTYPTSTAIGLGPRCGRFKRGAITSVTSGRLGNHILIYVAIWTFAMLYDMDGYVYWQSKAVLDTLFEEMPPLRNLDSVLKECNVTGVPLMYILETAPVFSEIVDMAKRTSRILAIDERELIEEGVIPFVGAIKNAFSYKNNFVESAQKTLNSIYLETLEAVEKPVKEVVFVGVHVRRTDYATLIHRLFRTVRTADEDYYRRAVSWMRTALYLDRFRPVTITFVVVSDDPDWCSRVLLPHLRAGNRSDALGQFEVFYGGSGDVRSPEHDLVLLSSCNHTIHAYGTFGLWAALASGGRAVVYGVVGPGGGTISMAFAKHIPTWAVL